MKNLKYFIGGVIFYVIGIPIIESLAETITTLLEIPKGKVSVPVLKLNKELKNIQGDEEPVNTNVIGFEIPSEVDYYDEDDDFDDKKKTKI